MIYKLLWLIRSLVYIFLFPRFRMPSYLARPIFISGYRRLFIGKKVRILPGSRIEILDNNSSIVFEDDISVGQNLHIISGGSQELIVGSKTTISANVFITNVEHQYENIDEHIMVQPLRFRSTEIGQNCFLGYGVVIQAGTVLGKHCIVGANSVVRGFFPDYSVIAGVPAKIIKKYDEVNKVWRKTDATGVYIDEV